MTPPGPACPCLLEEVNGRQQNQSNETCIPIRSLSAQISTLPSFKYTFSLYQ